MIQKTLTGELKKNISLQNPTCYHYFVVFFCFVFNARFGIVDQTDGL